MPDAPQPDVGAELPALVRRAGLDIVDAWAESQAGAGPGPVADYLASLKDCPFLENVDLKFCNGVTIEKLDLRKFQIDANINALSASPLGTPTVVMT